MRRFSSLRALAWLACAPLAFAACPSDDPAPTDDTTATDTVAPDAGDDTADATADSGVDTAEPPVEYTRPAYFPSQDTAADEVLALADLGLEGHVRVVYDDRGIPHIYGDSATDLARVQGYVVARDRIFQMHTLRLAASGRLAELSGTGSLSGDFFLRMIKLRRTAEAIAARTAIDDPELHAVVEAYADGVNVFLERMKAGLEARPLEANIFGVDAITPWTAADTMTIVRLQTWDLGFDDRDLSRFSDVRAIGERLDGTGLESAAVIDFLDYSPIRDVATWEPEGGASTTGTFDITQTLADPYWDAFSAERLERVREVFDAHRHGPHRPFSGPDFGSNSWVVSGDHTASGRPILANDTHLALRNPAVFYHVALSNTLAGGDMNVNGVNFAGAPGIVLGHNDHAAWGATVLATDVTDIYIERLNAARTAVTYDGAEVPLVEREETFRFNKPVGDAPCLASAPAWAAALENRETVTDGICELTVTFLDVPHRGPLVPWSFDTDAEGDPIAMSIAWTGFEPTLELSAVWRLNTAASEADLKEALDFFDVGAQSWIFALGTGEIGWYPSHALPVRAHIADGDTTFPPFLPMPGHTSDTAWDGFVPRAELPQVTDPARGWIVTANADPSGTTFDSDPFNDGPYLGYSQWTVGHRVGRITDRLAELVDRGDITVADMQALQGDHHSNVGASMTPYLIAAIEAAQDGTDSAAQQQLTGQVTSAYDLLTEWRDSGFAAANGVGAESGSVEARSAAATALFNVWMVMLVQNVLAPHDMNRGGDHKRAQLLWRMSAEPETMATWDDVRGDSALWDPDPSDGTTVTRAEQMVKSLVMALDFLAATDKVGVAQAGGFGTSDMDAWRWGALHTVTLRHNVSAGFDIPPASEHESGFPRHCDNFCVDASHPGFGDTLFTFSSGAALRNVYELFDAPTFHGVVPGGQSENTDSPFYRDGMDLWVANEAPEIPSAPAAVVAVKSRIVDFVAPE